MYFYCLTLCKPSAKESPAGERKQHHVMISKSMDSAIALPWLKACDITYQLCDLDRLLITCISVLLSIKLGKLLGFLNRIVNSYEDLKRVFSLQ